MRFENGLIDISHSDKIYGINGILKQTYFHKGNKV